METMTVLMDLMRCRNLIFGFPLNNILYLSGKIVELYGFSIIVSIKADPAGCDVSSEWL